MQATKSPTLERLQSSNLGSTLLTLIRNKDKFVIGVEETSAYLLYENGETEPVDDQDNIKIDEGSNKGTYESEDENIPVYVVSRDELESLANTLSSY